MTQRRGHVARGRLDRLAEPDRRLRVRLALHRGAARARDRARHAAAVRSSVFAALAIASTSSLVMSVSRTSTVATLATVPAWRGFAGGCEPTGRCRACSSATRTREEAERRERQGLGRKNRDDGSVEAVFEGEPDMVDAHGLVRAQRAGQLGRLARRRRRRRAGGSARLQGDLTAGARGGWIGGAMSTATRSEATAAPVAAEPERKSAPQARGADRPGAADAEGRRQPRGRADDRPLAGAVDPALRGELLLQLVLEQARARRGAARRGARRGPAALRGRQPHAR